MNKFLTFAGTQPVYLGDIDFMQNAASQGFSQIAAALLNSPADTLNAILQGVEVTNPAPNTVSWTSGVVVIAGEILPLASGSITADPSETPLYVHVVSALSGERTFKDGTTKQCYETRSATISTVAENGVLLSSFLKLHEESYRQDYQPIYFDGDITSAKLRARGGMYYLEFSFNTEGGHSNLGKTTFIVGHPAGESFETSSFNGVLLGQKTDNTWAVIPISLSFDPFHEDDYDRIIITATIRDSSFAGSATFKGIVPLFY